MGYDITNVLPLVIANSAFSPEQTDLHRKSFNPEAEPWTKERVGIEFGPQAGLHFEAIQRHKANLMKVVRNGLKND